jgi:hypothetical protein
MALLQSPSHEFDPKSNRIDVIKTCILVSIPILSPWLHNRCEIQWRGNVYILFLACCSSPQCWLKLVISIFGSWRWRIQKCESNDPMYAYKPSQMNSQSSLQLLKCIFFLFYTWQFHMANYFTSIFVNNNIWRSKE